MCNFDDIRPYQGSEVAAAIQRVAESEAFPILSAYVFPDNDVYAIKKRVLELKTVDDFQREVMAPFAEQIIRRSCTSFECQGIENLDKDLPYVFVSNHRDIVLDSLLLQQFLFEHDFPTTQITFGANLMSTPLVIDLGKINKMFRVERGATPKEFYRLSRHLSDYIRHVVRDLRESVWIAQRNGRTKDGIDRTDQGIIKMFGLSRQENRVEALAELNIVPVSVSYEWESCDVLKAVELYKRRGGQPYVKQPGEDLHSILHGIMQPKGRVVFKIHPVIAAKELRPIEHLSLNEYNQAVAKIVDERIISGFELWPNNFIAYDLLHDQTQMSEHYTDAERDAFLGHMHQLDNIEGCDQDELRNIFLSIYANPIDSLKSL